MNAMALKVDEHAVALQLEQALQEKVSWIAKYCWPENVKNYLGKMVEMIRAAQELGVDELASVNFKYATPEEDQLLVSQLQRLRTLGMEDEVRKILCGMLEAMGVPEHFYIAPPPPQRGEDEEIGWDGDV